MTDFSSVGTRNSPVSLLRKVAVSVSWLALAQIGRRAWGLIVIAVLARLLTPADFGLIALTTLSLGVISMFAETGLTSALIQSADIEEEHLSTAFWLNMTVSVALALVAVALAHWLSGLYREPRIAPLLMAMVLTLPLNALGQVSGALLQKRLAFRSIAIIDLVSTFVSGLIGIMLAFKGVGVWALVAQHIVLACASTLGRAIAAKWKPQLLFSGRKLREMSSFSASVLGCSVANYAVRNIDNALVGGALGTAALGYYSMAYNLVLMPGASINGLVGQVLFPALSSIQNDPAHFRGIYLRALRMAALVAFPCAIGLGALAPLVVRTIYGPQWAPVVPLLQILTVIGVLESINISGIILFAMGRPLMLLYWSLAALVLMTIGFVVGVRWGVTGVAWSYVALSPFVSIVPHIISYRLISLRFQSLVETLAPCLGSALIMGFLLWISMAQLTPLFAHSWMELLLLTSVGALVYTLLLAVIYKVWGLSIGFKFWLTGHHLMQLKSEAHVK